MLLVPEDSHLRVFFQLFAHGGFIDFERGIRVGQIVCNTIGDLADTEGNAVSKNIQDAEMQYDILVSKALCFQALCSGLKVTLRLSTEMKTFLPSAVCRKAM